MCNCIEDIDAKLAPEHCLDATLNFRPGEVRIALIGLIRRDNYTRESRRGKARTMFANYCPWCGEKYPDWNATPDKKDEAA